MFTAQPFWYWFQKGNKKKLKKYGDFLRRTRYLVKYSTHKVGPFDTFFKWIYSRSLEWSPKLRRPHLDLVIHTQVDIESKGYKSNIIGAINRARTCMRNQRVYYSPGENHTQHNHRALLLLSAACLYLFYWLSVKFGAPGISLDSNVACWARVSGVERRWEGLSRCRSNTDWSSEITEQQQPIESSPPPPPVQ